MQYVFLFVALFIIALLHYLKKTLLKIKKHICRFTLMFLHFLSLI